MATLQALLKLLVGPKLTPFALGNVRSQIPSKGEGEELEIFRAWKDKIHVGFTTDAYQRFWETLSKYEGDFPDVVKNEIFAPERLAEATAADIRRRLLHGGRRINGRVVLPWVAFERLDQWMKGAVGKRGTTLRNAIERMLAPAAVPKQAPQPAEALPPTPPPKAPAKAPTIEKEQIIPTIAPQPTQGTPTMEQFAKDFLKEAEANDGLVGRRTLGKLMRDHNTPATPALVSSGWIEAVVGEGRRRVGWYRAGARTLAAAQSRPATLPTNPVERAQALIGQKAELQAEKIRLEAQLAECNQKLETIARAEELMAQLDKVMK